MSAEAVAVPEPVAVWSFLLFFPAFLLVERGLTRPPPGEGRRGRRDGFTFALFFVLPLVGVGLWIFYLRRGVIPYEPTWVHWGAGLALALGGFWVRIVGKRTLGRFFAIRVQLQEDHQLVDTGPYAKIRHPLYAGFLLEWSAPPFLLGSPVGILFVTLPMLLAVLRRIPREEALMIEAFGDRYRAYMRRTKRLIPYLW
ncbi:MAG TPA: isoprenylcysteine carboxylmethyltransferase family protein [Candidatus Eisenbacteria bacterium]|jgi:protein-S-isoprenylcysteine O-methyltransferase Ste14